MLKSCNVHVATALTLSLVYVRTYVCMCQIALLKKLRALCSEKDGDVAITVRKLAMVSLTAVFKDIAPRCV